MTTSHSMTATRRVADTGGRAAVMTLCLLGAALMIVSGAIHLHLWDQFYRHITTGHLNVLFMVQTVASFVGALTLLVWRHWIVVLGSAGLMLGTAVGYLIARYHSGGLFGFALPDNFSSSYATWSLIVEFAATGILLIAAGLMARNARRSAGF